MDRHWGGGCLSLREPLTKGSCSFMDAGGGRRGGGGRRVRGRGKGEWEVEEW